MFGRERIERLESYVDDHGREIDSIQYNISKLFGIVDVNDVRLIKLERRLEKMEDSMEYMFLYLRALEKFFHTKVKWIQVEDENWEDAHKHEVPTVHILKIEKRKNDEEEEQIKRA